MGDFRAVSERSDLVKFNMSPVAKLEAVVGTTELPIVRLMRLLLADNEERELGEFDIIPSRLSNSESKFWATELLVKVLGDCLSGLDEALMTSGSNPAPEK